MAVRNQHNGRCPISRGSSNSYNEIQIKTGCWRTHYQRFFLSISLHWAFSVGQIFSLSIQRECGRDFFVVQQFVHSFIYSWYYCTVTLVDETSRGRFNYYVLPLFLLSTTGEITDKQREISQQGRTKGDLSFFVLPSNITWMYYALKNTMNGLTH